MGAFVLTAMAGLLIVVAGTLVVLSLREKPSTKKNVDALEETRIEFPVQAEIKELETKVHRQVEQIQRMAAATPAPTPAHSPTKRLKPITLAPKPAAEARKPEHDTRMIRLVEEKSEEIQRLAEESARDM